MAKKNFGNIKKINHIQMIGPKNIFEIPISEYKNKSNEDLECLDDYSSKSLPKDELQTAKFNYHNSTNNIYPKKKVRFNMDIVLCKFSNNEPALSISKQTKKLISSSPNLKWVNPTFFNLKNQ
ncbi:unnamed protein product (macronuclear) [Paramecium tetraurelia]|uniref:Uncharacterized protein n=1 Tax=Paramecium tetraurelia TaxID=5888 RepID=A0EAH4_PARTE|nr:uncharacterized protein GSPATT00025023001 [Paramecium tetraurelia]CAK92291.1 unnamed protein product [Paramecium tetraurelia]|eukprot:XP_001459688.1 hypothetical protein (macronuclear) [Paramecium tetraurelia strain d4-2]